MAFPPSANLKNNTNNKGIHNICDYHFNRQLHACTCISLSSHAKQMNFHVFCQRIDQYQIPEGLQYCQIPSLSLVMVKRSHECICFTETGE